MGSPIMEGVVFEDFALVVPFLLVVFQTSDELCAGIHVQPHAWKQSPHLHNPVVYGNLVLDNLHSRVFLGELVEYCNSGYEERGTALLAVMGEVNRSEFPLLTDEVVVNKGEVMLQTLPVLFDIVHEVEPQPVPLYEGNREGIIHA